MISAARPAEGWDEHRWYGILERIEHRQAGIGLRFCGPPLWLEVTMQGPDSEAWSTADAGEIPDRSWDWQSSEACGEAMSLDSAGADDECLLASASRYTLENLVLNAVHEIGEWLRFDARRLFPAHGGYTTQADGSTRAVGDGLQGNGIVNVHLTFDPTPTPWIDRADEAAATRLRMTSRASELAGAWRFTYLPGTSISYGPDGPVVTRTDGLAVTRTDGPVLTCTDGASAYPAPAPSPTWSTVALDAVDASVADFVGAVERDVHRAVVLYEAGRVCDAFHVDGRRPWRLAVEDCLSEERSKSRRDRRPVAVSVSYRSEAP
jgi:hypothetical protein